MTDNEKHALIGGLYVQLKQAENEVNLRMHALSKAAAEIRTFGHALSQNPATATLPACLEGAAIKDAIADWLDWSQKLAGLREELKMLGF